MQAFAQISLLFLLCLSAWDAAANCPQIPPKPVQVTVTPVDGPVVIETVRSMVETSAREAALNRELNLHAQGVTIISWDNRMSFDVSGYQQANGQACFWLTKVKVGLGYAKQTVRMLAKHPPGSCNYQVVHEHELQHVAFNRQSLRNHAPIITQAMQSVAQRIGVVHGEKSQIMASIQAQLANVFKPRVQSMLDSARHLHATIDSPTAYRIASRRCPSW